MLKPAHSLTAHVIEPSFLHLHAQVRAVFAHDLPWLGYAQFVGCTQRPALKERGRALLTELLQTLADNHPNPLFERTARGLSTQTHYNGRALQLSVSYARDVVLIGIAPKTRASAGFGLDLIDTVPLHSWAESEFDALAQLYLDAPAQAAIASTQHERKRALFAQQWTQFEAHSKALAQGGLVEYAALDATPHVAWVIDGLPAHMMGSAFCLCLN